jgi:hypothetical protein
MDWKEKLKSRKFLTMAVTVVTLLGASFGLSEAVVAQITTIITAGGIVMTWLHGQSKVDAIKEDRTENTINLHGMSKEDVAALVKEWLEENDYGRN